MARIQARGNWYFKNGFKNAKFYEPWLVNLLYNLTSKVSKVTADFRQRGILPSFYIFYRGLKNGFPVSISFDVFLARVTRVLTRVTGMLARVTGMPARMTTPPPLVQGTAR